MAYQHADGFDNYGTSSSALNSRYDLVGGAPTVSSTFARFAPPAGLPGAGVKFGSSTNLRKNLKSNQANLISFFAFYLSALPSSGWLDIFVFLDNGAQQCQLSVSASGQFGFRRGSTVLASTGPGVITINLYYGLESQVVIDGAAGSISSWLGGVALLTAAGLNTKQTANAYANQVQLGDGNNGIPAFNFMYADDYRVWDNTGSYQNSPVQLDRRLVTKLPSGAGVNSVWTPNGAAANWQCTDDNPADGDTTYVSSTAAGTVDDYAMPSAGLAVAPTMVVSLSYARKDDTSTRALQTGVLSGATTSFGTPVTMTSTYAWVDSCISLDPNTSAVWTATGADTAHHAKNEST